MSRGPSHSFFSIFLSILLAYVSLLNWSQQAAGIFIPKHCQQNYLGIYVYEVKVHGYAQTIRIPSFYTVCSVYQSLSPQRGTLCSYNRTRHALNTYNFQTRRGV